MHIAQWFQQAYMFLSLINCHMLKTNVAYMLLGMYPSFVLVKLCHTISTVCFFWQPKRRNVMQQIASFTHAPLKFLCPGLMFSNYSCCRFCLCTSGTTNTYSDHCNITAELENANCHCLLIALSPYIPVWKKQFAN